MRRARAITILALAAAVRLFPSADAGLQKEYERWVHRSWTTRDGLPQNTVYALAQAADGCLWIGSEGGVARFDGSAFSVFRKNATPGLASDSITSLAAGRDGALWVGTFGGGLSLLRDGRFTRIKGLASERIWSLHRDGKETLWIVAAEGGVSCLERDGRPAQALIDGLPDRRVTAVAGSEKGTLWIGTRGGLAAIRDNRETLILRRDGLAGNDVYCLFVDSRGSLWAGTTTGLSRIDGTGIRRFTTADGLADDLVRAIGEDAQGRLWIGTDKGVTVLAAGGEPACATLGGPGQDAVMAICRDREDGMWVGTASGGLSYWRRNEARTYGSEDGLSGLLVTSICEDAAGRLWVGTRGQGLNRRENGVWRSVSGSHVPAGAFVTSLLADARQRLWIGTLDAGLRLLEDGRPAPVPPGGPAGGGVLSLFADRRGRFWIGSAGDGLYSFLDGHWRHYGTASGLKGGAITALNEDRQGRLWAGSAGDGLHLLQGRTWRRFSVADGLAGDSVYAIHVDGSGGVWLGTDGGLGLYSRGRLHSFRRAGGPLNGAILSIIEDDAGRLWMSSPSGILCARRAELERAAPLEGRGVPCRLFGEMAGLRSSVCSGGFQPAACRDRDGRLWFPTQRGLVEIDPQGLALPPPPIPRIERVQADGLLVAPAGGGPLPAGAGRIDFQYAAPFLSDPRQVEYSSRLAGLELDWSAPARENSRSFNRLPAGSYVFRVRARGLGGDWSGAAAFRFTVAPRFRQTAGFYWLLLAGGGASVAGLLFYRRRRERRRREERYKSSPLDGGKADEYAARLEKAMENGKAFLDPELTLAKLAEATDIPAKQLSQLVNERFGLNFNDFVNRRRVEEAKRLLLDPAAREFKLLRIAFESGFNSKSVFNAAFRKHAGASPSEFRRLLGNRA